MDIKIHSNYLAKKNDLIESILKFDAGDQLLFDGSRNQIKVTKLKNQSIAIKSFKIPNAFNKIIYKYFRKSKAQRSYEYAKFLSANDIGTASPIAYSMRYSSTGLQESFYLSEFLQVDLVLRELLNNNLYPEREIILRQFTRFTFRLHELGVEFLDHSPGNTLIKKNSPGEYEFFLIDLNRMRFHKDLSLNRRLRNFNRLTQNLEVIHIMSAEYASLSHQDPAYIFQKMAKYAVKHGQKRAMKQKVKHLISL